MERTFSEELNKLAEYEREMDDAYDNAFIKSLEHIAINEDIKPEKDFIEFETIWNNYFSIIPIEYYEYDIYGKIIKKIRDGDFNFAEDTYNFIKLTDIIADMIYRYKKLKNMKEYSDTEINCCYRVKKYLTNYLKNIQK